MSDYKALFKAAKAQRTTTPAKLSKDQLRALKAQKAAAAAAEAEEAARRKAQEDAAKAAAAAAPPVVAAWAKPTSSSSSSRALAPPPMFSAPRPNAAASFHADSQATQIRQAGTSLERLRSDASTGGSRATRPAAAATAHGNGMSVPASLPPNFFESGAAAPEDGPLASAVPSSSSAMAAPPGASDSSTSQPAASSTVTARVGGALPAGFFQDGSAEESTSPVPDLQLVDGPGAGALPAAAKPAEGEPSTSALPKGFFENKEADAKARGEAPPKKRTAEEAFSDFMASVSSDVRQVEAREEEEAADAATDRAERDAFEQRLRRQRLEELKRGGGAALTAVPIAAQLPSAAEEVVLDTASIAAEAERFAPRKRRRGDALEVDAADGGGEGEEEGEEEDDDEDLMLDWRAKRV